MADLELNWPKKGDQLFRADLPDWQHTAQTGQNWYSDDIGHWHDYVFGYREAAKRVIQGAIGQDPRGMLDVLVYPVVFLYRHHVELALKTIIRVGRRYNDEEQEDLGQHGLTSLWQKARKIIEEHWHKDSNGEVDATEKLILELDKIDPGSFAFRYPEKRDGSKTLPGPVQANLRHFGEIAERMSNFLDSCFQGLWNDLDQKQEFLADMAQMYGDEW